MLAQPSSPVNCRDDGQTVSNDQRRGVRDERLDPKAARNLASFVARYEAMLLSRAVRIRDRGGRIDISLEDLEQADQEIHREAQQSSPLDYWRELLSLLAGGLMGAGIQGMFTEAQGGRFGSWFVTYGLLAIIGALLFLLSRRGG